MSPLLEALIGRKWAILDADWSRIGTLETLIGSRAECEVCQSLSVSEGFSGRMDDGFRLSGRSVAYIER